MKEQMYKQCKLEKIMHGARVTKMSWLPVEFCVEGSVVKLKNHKDVWTDGWVVKSASGEAQPEKFVNAASRAHLKQRKASDI